LTLEDLLIQPLETVKENRHNIVQDGKLYLNMQTNMADLVNLLKRNNLTNEDVNWLVPHQANKRIIDATARMNLEESKVLMNIESMEILHLQPYL
jgi:3-oxoacyl-[acyl-carrier-protein] synthase-3